MLDLATLGRRSWTILVVNNIYSSPNRRGCTPKVIVVGLAGVSLGVGSLAIKEGAAIEESSRFLNELERGIKPKDDTIVTIVGELESVGMQGSKKNTLLYYRIKVPSKEGPKEYARVIEELPGNQSDKFKRDEKFNAIIRGPYRSISGFDRELYQFEIAGSGIGEVTIGKLFIRKP